VVGYITQRSGVSIHRQDCSNISHLREHNERRFIDINFDDRYKSTYPVDIVVIAYNRAGLLRDITGAIAGEEIHLAGIRTHEVPGETDVYIYLTIIISSISELAKAQAIIKSVDSVTDVRRA
jgi:GTP pyrophosphokinase